MRDMLTACALLLSLLVSSFFVKCNYHSNKVNVDIETINNEVEEND